MFAIVRNCILPTDLYYQVEEHLWVRVNPDGTATVGLTDVAQTVAGGILHVTFKKMGRDYARGETVAVIESAKWLGVVRTPLSGRLVAVNERLAQDPGLVNRSPYRAGWLVQVAPFDLPGELPLLLTGEAAVQAYERLMAERNLDDCVHCEGYELP